MCGWVMECVEKGYITKEQLGFELKWGDAKGARQLIEIISHRKGLGNILAEGTKRAAEKLGGPAQECAIYTMKGAVPRGHDHRNRWEEMLDTCTSADDDGVRQSGPSDGDRPARAHQPVRRRAG